LRQGVYRRSSPCQSTHGRDHCPIEPLNRSLLVTWRQITMQVHLMMLPWEAKHRTVAISRPWPVREWPTHFCCHGFITSFATLCFASSNPALPFSFFFNVPLTPTFGILWIPSRETQTWRFEISKNTIALILLVNRLLKLLNHCLASPSKLNFSAFSYSLEDPTWNVRITLKIACICFGNRSYGSESIYLAILCRTALFLLRTSFMNRPTENRQCLQLTQG